MLLGRLQAVTTPASFPLVWIRRRIGRSGNGLGHVGWRGPLRCCNCLFLLRVDYQWTSNQLGQMFLMVFKHQFIVNILQCLIHELNAGKVHLHSALPNQQTFLSFHNGQWLNVTVDKDRQLCCSLQFDAFHCVVGYDLCGLTRVFFFCVWCADCLKDLWVRKWALCVRCVLPAGRAPDGSGRWRDQVPIKWMTRLVSIHVRKQRRQNQCRVSQWSKWISGWREDGHPWWGRPIHLPIRVLALIMRKISTWNKWQDTHQAGIFTVSDWMQVGLVAETLFYQNLGWTCDRVIRALDRFRVQFEISHVEYKNVFNCHIYLQIFLNIATPSICGWSCCSNSVLDVS